MYFYLGLLKQQIRKQIAEIIQKEKNYSMTI